VGNPKKSFSAVGLIFVHTFDYLRYLSRRPTATNLPTSPENVTTMACKMHNILIGLKVRCVSLHVGGSEKSRLWVGIGGSKKTRCYV